MTEMKFLFGLGLFIVMVFSFEALLFPELTNPSNLFYSLDAEKQEIQPWLNFEEWAKYAGSFEKRYKDEPLGLLDEWKFAKAHEGEYSPYSVVVDDGFESKTSILSYLADMKRILTFDIPTETGMPGFIRPIIAIPIWLCVAFLTIKIISGIIPFVGGVK